MARTVVKSSDLLVDRPVEWNIYDPDGNLLFAKGSVIDAEAKANLLKRGALRDIDAEMNKLSGTHPGLQTTRPDQPVKGIRLLLSDTAVRPGAALNLDRDLDGSRVMARLIGYLKGRSIVITVPVDEQGQVFLKEGETVQAKIFSGKHILAFNASVLAVVLKPFPHIHLSYPPEVTGVVVRRSERTEVRLIAAVDIGNEQVPGIVTDLSIGGLSLVSRSPLIRVGAELVVNFKLMLADCPFLVKLRGVVRAVRAQQSDVLEGATAYGVQFRELSAEDVLIIDLFVSQQLMTARSASA
jgi:c-di-GMP-binding flagellar brake protein YcgR